MNLAGRIWIVFLGLSLVGAGWILTKYLWHSYERAALMNPWVEVSCQIVSSEIDDSQLNQKGFTKYRLDLSYTYDYEGKEYTGNRLQRLPTESSDLKKVQKKQETWSAGNGATCWVDPKEPSSAVLKKDTKAALYSIWFPCLFIVGGAGMVLSALFRKRS